jgi:hypothetical protein
MVSVNIQKTSIVIVFFFALFCLSSAQTQAETVCEIIDRISGIKLCKDNTKDQTTSEEEANARCIPINSDIKTNNANKGATCTPDVGGCQISYFEKVNTEQNCNWDSTNAAKVCSRESAGGNVNICSRTDLCDEEIKLSNGDLIDLSFSCGLFQINIIDSINQDLFPSCYGLIVPKSQESTYDSKLNIPLGGCAVDKKCLSSGVCFCPKRRCGLANGKTAKDYEKCINELANPVKNISHACNLYKRSGFKPWAASASLCIK